MRRTGGAVMLLAALFGAAAVAAGALGAHGFTGKPAEWLRTGAEYQMVHAVAALVAAQMGARVAAGLFVGGGLLFAGTLYAIAFGGPQWLGAVTPIGGVGLILGWLALAVRFLRK